MTHKLELSDATKKVLLELHNNLQENTIEASKALEKGKAQVAHAYYTQIVSDLQAFTQSKQGQEFIKFLNPEAPFENTGARNSHISMILMELKNIIPESILFTATKLVCHVANHGNSIIESRNTNKESMHYFEFLEFINEYQFICQIVEDTKSPYDNKFKAAEDYITNLMDVLSKPYTSFFDIDN